MTTTPDIFTRLETLCDQSDAIMAAIKAAAEIPLKELAAGMTKEKGQTK